MIGRGLECNAMAVPQQLVLSDGDRRKSLAAAMSCICLFGITVAVMSPLVSLNLEARGVERTTIGLMAAVPALTLLATNPFIPALVRFFGFRRYIFGCIALQLLLVLLMPVFDSVPAWFVLRGMMGAAVNGLFVASETWINSVAEEHSRGRVLAIYGTVLSGSFALGPLIIAFAGSDGFTPFLVIAGIILLAALPLLWTAQVSPVIEGRPTFGVLSFLILAPTLVGAVFLAAFKEMSLSALLPVYGIQSGFAEGSAAALLTVGYVGSLLSQLPVGWLADRMDRYVLLICLTVVGLAGAVGLPFVMQAEGVLVWIYVGVWIGLSSGSYIVAMAIVGERFRGADLVAANSAFGFLWGMGSLTGPALSGAAMDVMGKDGFVVPIACVAGLYLLISVYRQAVRSKAGAPTTSS